MPAGFKLKMRSGRRAGPLRGGTSEVVEQFSPGELWVFSLERMANLNCNKKAATHLCLICGALSLPSIDYEHSFTTTTTFRATFRSINVPPVELLPRRPARGCSRFPFAPRSRISLKPIVTHGAREAAAVPNRRRRRGVQRENQRGCAENKG